MNSEKKKGLITALQPSKTPEGRVIYILRHGQTLLNKEDKIRGWSDIPLDDEGIVQAKKLGEAFRNSQIELDGIFTSNLLRAEQTALEVSQQTGYPVLGIRECLRPWNVGSYTGKDGKMVHEIMAEAAYKEPDKPIGGGESFNIFKYRFLLGLIGLLNQNRGLKLGFVSHSRGERIMHSWVAAGCPEDLGVDLEVFLAHGEPTASAQELVVDCPLVLP